VESLCAASVDPNMGKSVGGCPCAGIFDLSISISFFSVGLSDVFKRELRFPPCVRKDGVERNATAFELFEVELGCMK